MTNDEEQSVSSRSSSDALDELLDLLKLERLEVNLFRGPSRDIGTPRVFGGQVLSQALLAASHTVEDRLPHSLHAYFLRAGDPEAPIVYDVDRARDGRSFTMRRVVAIQHGRPILNLAASFQVEEDGLEHQAAMPEVPPPESLSEFFEIPEEDIGGLPQKLARWFSRGGPFEFRSCRQRDPFNPEPMAPEKAIWFRCSGDVPDDPALSRALLAYVSDFHLVGTATLPHGVSLLTSNLQLVSLDHGMFFHRPTDVTDWHLYSCDSPSASAGRGLARGQIFRQDGTLIASTIQEGVMRLWDSNK